jgi:hypothetical protein
MSDLVLPSTKPMTKKPQRAPRLTQRYVASEFMRLQTGQHW